MLRVLLSAAVLVGGVLAASAAQAAPFPIYDGRTVAAVVHDDAGAAPLAKAADLLARDLTALTGQAPTVSTTAAAGQGPEVLIGLAASPRIAALLRANHIDAAGLKGKWETYGRAGVRDPAHPDRPVLLIFGSDVRGTIWGVTDLSRELGVSPWEWWADVKIRHADRLAVDGALAWSKTPKVKYRGVFLNDEEFGLWPWAANTHDPRLHDLGPRTYARIYELMWRLKANTLWPAMRGIERSFNQIPGNRELISAYGLVRASSHVEMMTRTNIREWDEKARGPYNYFTNRDRVLSYWDEGVKQAAPFETMYTVGMRGIEDRPIQGASTPADQAKVMERIFKDQRDMLSRDLNKPLDQIPQVFTPYKEVLPAYDAGMKVPGDVTLNWPDDNYGYIRRLSNAEERKRPGGSGVYYHISYWGYPMSYLWLADTHPALMWEEMTKAYRFDARRFWILNVGDIKPGEYLTQLFLDLAFDPDAFPDVASVKAHLRRWAAESFGEADADRIAELMWRNYALAFDRNPEFMGFNRTRPVTAVQRTGFDLIDFGDENARRLAAYKALSDEAAALMQAMPADRRDAFYELVQYPVDAAAQINARQLDLDKSIAYADQHRASANVYADQAKAAQAAIAAGGRAYNDQVAGGKWKDMMGLNPHGLPLFQPPAIPAWSDPGDGGCAVQAEGGWMYDGHGSTPGQPDFLPHLLRPGATELPPMHPELAQTRYVDIFTRAPAAVNWTASADQPWIRLSKTSGAFSPATRLYEQRVEVSVDWAHAPEGGKGLVSFRCEGQRLPLPVTVNLAKRDAATGVSFIESDRIVSMYAAHADATAGAWRRLDGLGHTGLTLQAGLDLPSLDPADPASLARAPSATWRFSTTTDDDPATVKVVALPFLPVTSDNHMRAAVSVDGGPVQVLDFAAPEFSVRWMDHVLTNAAAEGLHDLRLRPGAHTVTVRALDPGFTLERVEVDFDGAPKAYGPPPETRIRP